MKGKRQQRFCRAECLDYGLGTSFLACLLTEWHAFQYLHTYGFSREKQEHGGYYRVSSMLLLLLTLITTSCPIRFANRQALTRGKRLLACCLAVGTVERVVDHCPVVGRTPGHHLRSAWTKEKAAGRRAEP